MTRVLVTGATGLVGGAALAALLGTDAQVVAYVRDAARLDQTGGTLDVRVGDLQDDAALRAALDGVDAVILISGHGLDMADVQQAAIRTIADSGVRRVVKVSGSPASVQPGGGSSIGLDHLAVEETLRAAVPEPVVLRPSVFMQNFLAMAPAVAHGVLPGPEGDPAVSVVDAVDVGRAAAAASLAEDPRALLEITGAEAVSYSAAAAELAGALGRPVAYAPVSVEVMRQGLAASGDPEWLAEHKVEMAQLMATAEAARVTSDFAELTGREPRSIAEFFSEHAAAYEATT